MDIQSKKYIHSSCSHIADCISFLLWYQQYDANYPLKQELGGTLALNGTDLVCQLLTQSSSNETKLMVKLTLPIIVGFGTYYLTANMDNRALKTLAKNYSVQAIVHIISSLADFYINKTKDNKDVTAKPTPVDQNSNLNADMEPSSTNPLIDVAGLVYALSVCACFFAFPRPLGLPRRTHFIHFITKFSMAVFGLISLKICSCFFGIPKENGYADKIYKVARPALISYGAFLVIPYVAKIPGISYLLRNDIPMRLNWHILAFDMMSSSILTIVFGWDKSPLYIPPQSQKTSALSTLKMQQLGMNRT